MEQYQKIYESMLGFLEPEEAVSWVENAFDDGSACAQAYAQMRKAYERLCDRLQVSKEDPDLDQIVDSLERIQKELSRRMFECGMQYAARKQ